MFYLTSDRNVDFQALNFILVFIQKENLYSQLVKLNLVFLPW